MTRSEMIRQLLSEYANQRAANDMALERRIAEAGQADPEILRLRDENRSLAFDTMKRLLTLTDESERRQAAEQMKQRGIFNNGEIRRRLVKAGFAENHLELQYRCPLCKDTAYVGEAPSRFCECFENRLHQMLCAGGGMAGTDEQCFERFDLNRFPEENHQRVIMEHVRRSCETYADQFPQTSCENIVLSGLGGTGKTFLLNCIYERVVRRGFGAVRVTSFKMFEMMRKQHFANSPEDCEFDRLLSAPLLLIDDLGSEPMMRNITVEYLFILLNERIAARKHTVITTNLLPEQIKERYGERISSRMFDKSRTYAVNLTGKDLRRL